ncbi:1246_t:CDS:2 [Cetraspora pellucida]|uniref:1246_t:CDS:1 n=1 Tax=Cetraspora pellucida TaxID=1433469 RepID=A0A9N9NML8_9GLOM|nr:1246_t:CDS:2 [Cetraspora pellucida]
MQASEPFTLDDRSIASQKSIYLSAFHENLKNQNQEPTSTLEIMALVMAYFKIALNRYVDIIAMTIIHAFVDKFTKYIEEKMIGLCTNDDKNSLHELIKEDDSIKHHRDYLINLEKNLKESLDNLIKFVPSTKSIVQNYGIPETTLRCVIKNDGPTRPGCIKVLTDYEKKQLVNYCLNMQKLNFGLTRSGSAKLPFVILKKLYDKECDKFQIKNDDKLVTKYTFTEVLESVYIATYIFTAICNVFKTTEQTNLLQILEEPTCSLSLSPSSLPSLSSSYSSLLLLSLFSLSSTSSSLLSLSSPSKSASNHACLIKTNSTKKKLMSEIEFLNKKIKFL